MYSNIYAEKWDEEGQGIYFHRLKTIPFPKSLRLLSFAIRATKEIEKGNYDLTLGVGNTLRADILQPHGGVHWAWFWRSLRAYDDPILWTIKFLGRIFSLKQWVSGWIEDAPYRKQKLPKIIAISDMVKQDMMHWYKIPEDQIVVIYNGVDLKRFHPRNRQYRQEIRKQHHLGDEFLILFVSNNFRMKGLGWLFRAVAQIKKEGHPPLKLLILGRDRQDPYLGLAKKTGISHEVVFAGFTDHPEKYYGAADLLVHPSFYDACSLTVLEALATGLPVITTEYNGAGDIITNGREGFVIKDFRNFGKLVDNISHFFDEEKWKEASDAARKLAENYSLERNYEEMVRLFEVMMKSIREMGR
jgi:UDP-glucose:(heptosyl)LPS alpha-1,3-glucosyltransferase